MRASGPPIIIELEEYKCPLCGRVCYGNGARTSHIRWHKRRGEQVVLKANKVPVPARKRWRVLVSVPIPITERAKIDVEAISCEVQNGALLFWDGGLTRAFGAGAWLQCVLLEPKADDPPAEKDPFENVRSG